MAESTRDKGFAAAATLVMIALVILYGVQAKYEETGALMARYGHYQDIHIMIFVGFGFLMCFLHRSGFTATSHAFFVAAVAVLWAMLNRGWWNQAFTGKRQDKVNIGINELMNGDFCAGAVLISLGAMIGRISALQLLIMAIVEVVIYHINEGILIYKYEVADVGGTMVIHLFGAYFGLACSFVLGQKEDTKNKTHEDETSTRVTDTMAMVGTLFLFCFWPSFNGGLAGLSNPYVAQRAVVNTLISISTSCLMAFALCNAFHGRLRMVDVQNATLAGGVFVGASADMALSPVGAMILGMCAAAVSVFGYAILQPLLKERLGLKDTCGIHNLHGMPAFFGSLAATITATVDDSFRGDVFTAAGRRSGAEQAKWQAAGWFTTLGIALVTGAMTGAMLTCLPTLETFYADDAEYEIPTVGEPKPPLEQNAPA